MRGGHRPVHQHGGESLLRDAGRLRDRAGEALLLTPRGADVFTLVSSPQPGWPCLSRSFCLNVWGGGVGWGLSPVLCSIVTMCLFKQRNLKIYIFYYEKYCFFYKVELDFMFYMKHLPKKERRIEQEGGDCL